MQHPEGTFYVGCLSFMRQKVQDVLVQLFPTLDFTCFEADEFVLYASDASCPVGESRRLLEQFRFDFGGLFAWQWYAWNEQQPYHYVGRPGDCGGGWFWEDEPVLIEIPSGPGYRITSDLGGQDFPLHDPSTCIGCKVLLCLGCGSCHTPGCRRALVVCEYAQSLMVSRDQYPEDRPLKKRGWSW